MARTFAFALISWIIALCFILGSVVYEIESEPVANLRNIADSFSEDIRDILDLLRMFISLIETANQRLGRVLRIQLETTIPSQSLETEPLDVLFNRFETACRSFRNRFISFMSFQAINSRTEKLSEGNIQEKFSEFKHLVVNPYLDGLGTGIQPKTSSNEFNSNNREVDEKTSDESLTDGVKTTNLPITIENEGIDESDDSTLNKSIKDTKKTSLVQTNVTIDDWLSTGFTEKANDTVKDQSATESLTDDGEVTLEEDESPTEPLVDERLNNRISNNTTIGEFITAKDDEKDRLDHSTKKLSSDLDLMFDTSSLSLDENEKTSKDSSRDAHLQLQTRKIDSDLEFLHRLSFDESYHRPLLVSKVGKPGKHFPNYSMIPETSFACEDQKYIPGVYADSETKCQVFHVCWPHKMESFLCPLGTIFNQQARSCDYWFSSKCSLSANHFGLNANFFEQLKPVHSKVRSSIVLYKLERQKSPTIPLIYRMKFLPIRFEESDYPKKQFLSDAEKLNELDHYLPKSKKDSSKEEIYLARNIYAELRSPQKFGAKNDKITNSDSSFLNMELREQKNEKRKEFIENRSGLIARKTENSNSGSAETTNSGPQTVELDTINVIGQSKSFRQETSLKNEYTSNSRKSPLVFKVFEIRENVLDQRILPQTREMLAASYRKLPKRKKL